MTEQEAKQKWCPFVRVTVTPNDAAWQGNMLTNRGDIPASNTDLLCIGHACMAWQWDTWNADNTGICGLINDPNVD